MSQRNYYIVLNSFYLLLQIVIFRLIKNKVPQLKYKFYKLYRSEPNKEVEHGIDYKIDMLVNSSYLNRAVPLCHSQTLARNCACVVKQKYPSTYL